MDNYGLPTILITDRENFGKEKHPWVDDRVDDPSLLTVHGPEELGRSLLSLVMGGNHQPSILSF